MGKALVIVGLVGAALANVVIGYAGPAVACLGIVVAAILLVDPGGLGGQVRHSLDRWGVPGMRRASSGAAPIAAMILLYTVPVPLGAFALLQGAPTTDLVASAPNSAQANFRPAAASPAATPRPTVPLSAPSAAATDTSVTSGTSPPARRGLSVSGTRQHRLVPLPPPPPPNRCGAPQNPWHYNFCGGATISFPPSSFCGYFRCTPTFWQHTTGYVEQCNDGYFSHSGGVRGSCAVHSGDYRPLNP